MVTTGVAYAATEVSRPAVQANANRCKGLKIALFLSIPTLLD